MEECGVCHNKPGVIIQYECGHSICHRCHIYTYHSNNARRCLLCCSAISIETITGGKYVTLASLSKKTKIPWSDDMTVGDLTYLLIDMESSMHTIDEINLIFRGKTGDRCKLLKDYGITSGDTIFHVLSLRGD